MYLTSFKATKIRTQEIRVNKPNTTTYIMVSPLSASGRTRSARKAKRSASADNEDGPAAASSSRTSAKSKRKDDDDGNGGGMKADGDGHKNTVTELQREGDDEIQGGEGDRHE